MLIALAKRFVGRVFLSFRLLKISSGRGRYREYVRISGCLCLVREARSIELRIPRLLGLFLKFEATQLSFAVAR